MKKVKNHLQSVILPKRLIDLAGIFSAIVLAGFLGRYGAEVLTSRINDELTKLVTGIFIGLLLGLGIGFLVRRAWGRLVGIVS